MCDVCFGRCFYVVVASRLPCDIILAPSLLVVVVVVVVVVIVIIIIISNNNIISVRKVIPNLFLILYFYRLLSRRVRTEFPVIGSSFSFFVGCVTLKAEEGGGGGGKGDSILSSSEYYFSRMPFKSSYFLFYALTSVRKSCDL